MIARDGTPEPDGPAPISYADLHEPYFRHGGVIDPCDHGRSWTGVDDTPLNAPVKRWRCDDCGHEQDIPR